MKKILSFVIVYLSIIQITFSQVSDMKLTKNGVSFERGLTWEMVLSKAKAEHKFVFVDCYATWCGPCKRMEREVFSEKGIAEFMDSNFISVRLQMDTTSHDNDEIKKWYAIAKEFYKAFKVDALPTFLFFTPEGRIVHKEKGFKNSIEFKNAAEKSKDTNSQYYTLIEKYNAGVLDYAAMPLLVNMTKEMGDKEISLMIATNYMRNYLEKLKEEDFFTQENLTFISSNQKIVNSQDRIFILCYKSSNRIDSIVKIKGYSRKLITDAIYRELVVPKMNAASINKVEPDWKSVRNSIRSKYTMSYVDEIVPKAKMVWYKANGEWKNYSKNLTKVVDWYFLHPSEYSQPSAMYLNNSAWDVFTYSNKKRELRNALKWINAVLEKDHNSNSAAVYLDTKANILYKLGNKEDAIRLQEKIVASKPKYVEVFIANLDKMKKGEATWIVKDVKPK